MSPLLSSWAVDVLTGTDSFPFFQLLVKFLHQEPKPVWSSVGLLGASWDDVSSCQHPQYSFLPVLPSRRHCPALLPLGVCPSGCAEGWRPLCVLAGVGEASKAMYPNGCRTYFLMVPLPGRLVNFFHDFFPKGKYSHGVFSPPPNLFCLQPACKQFGLVGSCLTSASNGIAAGLGF